MAGRELRQEHPTDARQLPALTSGRGEDGATTFERRGRAYYSAGRSYRPGELVTD